MSPVREWTGYAAICDVCGENITEEHSDYSAWNDKGFTLDHVKDCDGFACSGADGDIVLCSGCIGRYQPALDDEAWDELADTSPRALTRLRAWIAERRSDLAE